MSHLELKALHRGWRRHLKHFRRLRRRLARGQDPRVFCLSCSDSRVNVHEIFDLNAPGTIFEVKNVAGLFTEDAKSGLVYALSNLRPDFILIMHHTGCGGYGSLFLGDSDADIRRHLVDGGCVHAKLRVDEYFLGRGLKPDHSMYEQLLVEEGCRLQRDALMKFLLFRHPNLFMEFKDGRIKVLPLLYDTVTGRVLLVPEDLAGSEDMVRKEL